MSTTFREFLEEQLLDSEFRAEYDALESEFDTDMAESEVANIFSVARKA
jgi:hypothetical protein